jgi:DNA adenine methylase
MIRSPIVYSGSKYKLLSQLLPLFPSKINNFIDVFCGSCTVSLNVKAKNHLLNDSITPLIELYKNLKETTIEELIIRIEDVFTKYNIENNESKENYNTLRDDYNKTRDPLLLLVLTFISFNNAIRFNNDFKFNMPFGRKFCKDRYLKNKKHN